MEGIKVVRNFSIRLTMSGHPLIQLMLLCPRWHTDWYLKLQSGIYFPISETGGNTSLFIAPVLSVGKIFPVVLSLFP